MDQNQRNGENYALVKLSPWLAGLSLVSTAERALTIACAVLGALVAIAMFVNIGWWQALALGTGHALAYIAVANVAPRPWTWRLLGLIVLSLTHVFAFALLSVPGMGIVSLAYLVLGLVALVRYYPARGNTSQQLAKAQGFSSRDDFQWLVTTAPLATRLKLQRMVQSHTKAAK